MWVKHVPELFFSFSISYSNGGSTSGAGHGNTVIQKKLAVYETPTSKIFLYRCETPTS